MAIQESRLDVGGGVELFVARHVVDQPKGLIMIVHGLCEHSGRYHEVAARFNAFGYTVYRFDNRGHGRSGGERGYVNDFNEFIDDAEKVVARAKQENPGLPVFMLGHSMGGFIAASHGVKYPGRLSGQILSGAASGIQPMLAGLEGVDFSAKAREPIANALVDLVSRDPQVVSAYRNDPLNLKEFSTQLMSEVLIRGARWLMNHYAAYTYPCLVLHGGADQIVTPETSKIFYEKIASTDKELKIYDGLFHEILNEPEKDIVLEDIHRWLEKRI
jgi:alpha-beta hydrolase superfamily lysophospholipase